MTARPRLAAILLLLVLAGGVLAVPTFPPIGTAGQQHPGKFVWLELLAPVTRRGPSSFTAAWAVTR